MSYIYYMLISYNRSKITLKLLASIALLSYQPSFSSASENSSAEKLAPQIELSEQMCDLGTVPRNSKISYAFAVKNNGAGLLTIKCIYTSCGCTVAKTKKTKLRPGESTNVAVVIDTSVKDSEPTRSIYISSDDPHQPLATFTVSLTVAE